MKWKTPLVIGLLGFGLLASMAPAATAATAVDHAYVYTTLGGKCDGYVDVICNDGGPPPGGPTCEVFLSDTCRIRI